MTSLIDGSRYDAYSDRSRAQLMLSKFYAALTWTLITLALGALLWMTTESITERDRENAEKHAMRLAESNTRAYAQQLQSTIAHIDQITLDLRADVEENGTIPNLELRSRKGLYPTYAKLYVNIIGPDGNLLSSSISAAGKFLITELPLFQAHLRDNSRELKINEASMSSRLGRPVLRFSRRIDTRDGNFNGVAVVSVELDYLTAFHDEAMLGSGDFVTVHFVNGPLLVSKVDGTASAEKTFYRDTPIFDEAFGVRWEPAGKFKDDKMRIVAWKRLNGYPLVALSALSETTVFAAHLRTARDLRDITVIGSAFLLLFAVTGFTLTTRLAARRRQAEEVRATFRAATDAANEGFFIARPRFERDGSIVDFVYEDCNERGATMVGGKTREQIIGRTTSQLLPGSFGQEVIALYRRAMETGFHEDELRVPAVSPLRATWIYRRMVRAGSGLTVTLRDISEAKEHEQALANLANTDALTTLPNRHWLAGFLPTALQQAAEAGMHLAVLFIDLDDFKNINDTLGHEAGDELLRVAAVRLKSAVRASDHVVRLGGDEFTIVLQQVTLLDDVGRVARQVIKEISAPFTLLGTDGNRVNATIGISMYPQDGRDGETLLKHADIAMYAAKAAGKGRFHFYHSHLSDTLILKLGKEQALRRALEQDEFVMHYQPRVSADNGRLSSMEALVRWNCPERGLIYPLEFIDLAEDTGMIIALGELVLEKVCLQLAAWKAQNLALVPVSVNVSALQLREGKVSTSLACCLERHGLDPSLIEVELTESSMIEKSRVVADELEKLRQLGVKLLIDDFGTGYSSLAQLHRLDVDVLKVDRAFTSALGDGKEGELLFKAIVSMAGALDMCVVAEGVETAEQLHALQSLSCDEVQGYLVSPALPAQDMPSMMRRRFLFASPPNAALPA